MKLIEEIKLSVDIEASWARAYGNQAIIAILTGDAHGATSQAKQAAFFARRHATACEALALLESRNAA